MHQRKRSAVEGFPPDRRRAGRHRLRADGRAGRPRADPLSERTYRRGGSDDFRDKGRAERPQRGGRAGCRLPHRHPGRRGRNSYRRTRLRPSAGAFALSGPSRRAVGGANADRRAMRRAGSDRLQRGDAARLEKNPVRLRRTELVQPQRHVARLPRAATKAMSTATRRTTIYAIRAAAIRPSCGATRRSDSIR